MQGLQQLNQWLVFNMSKLPHCRLATMEQKSTVDDMVTDLFKKMSEGKATRPTMYFQNLSYYIGPPSPSQRIQGLIPPAW